MGDTAYDSESGQWDAMFRINVDTMRNATMAAVPQLLKRGGGAIVNIGALGALSGQGAMSAYCASKSTVMRLTESMAVELKGAGINVNCLLPSTTDTPANRQAMPSADRSGWVSLDALVDAMLFLASPAARAVHGAALAVTGAG